MTAVEEDALRLMEQVQGSFWERQDSAPLRSVMAAEGRSWPLPPCPDPAVALADEQYDTTPLSEDACLVRGTFRTVSLDAAMADTPRRLTAVCIRRPEGLRITHLHLSEDGPAASCREEAAGGERIRGNNAALRELIRQTSRALRERNRELEPDRKHSGRGAVLPQRRGIHHTEHEQRPARPVRLYPGGH